MKMFIGFLLILFISVVAVLQAMLGALTGQSDEWALVATTLGIAALFHPLRVRIQAAIGRIMLECFRHTVPARPI